MQQKEFIGFGCIKFLRNTLEENNSKRIFLVTGKDSYESCGAKKSIDALTSSYQKFRFHDFEKNPRIEDVKKGITLFRKEKYDIFITIGGGSVIDMAKLINILSVQPESPESYIKKNSAITEIPKPLIAIPTTAGSGSEATHFAVIYMSKKKYSLAHYYIIPNISFVDPTFTMSLPKEQTAYTGMDALSQAIESYWSVNSTDESKRFAREAIKLSISNLIESVFQPTPRTRYAMAKAAHLAGKAINLTKTTAPHAISYPFTSFFGVPHGHAVGLTLGEVLVYNSQVTDRDIDDSRGVSFVLQSLYELYSLLGSSNAIDSKKKIMSLMRTIGLNTRLIELNIHLEQEMELILDNINLERLVNNPRSFTKDSLMGILRNIA